MKKGKNQNFKNQREQNNFREQIAKPSTKFSKAEN